MDHRSDFNDKEKEENRKQYYNYLMSDISEATREANINSRVTVENTTVPSIESEEILFRKGSEITIPFYMKKARSNLDPKTGRIYYNSGK